MPRRIMGQCYRSDFDDLMHIADLLDKGQEVDLANLTNREKIAVRVLEHFKEHGIPGKTVFKLKEVLLWDMGNGFAAFEFKLLDKFDVETARLIRNNSLGVVS
jgi:hypothetical protein